MKIFQDKGKTILPRVDSIFLLTRLFMLLGVGWFIGNSRFQFWQMLPIVILAFTYFITLFIFWCLLRKNIRDLRIPYLLIILFELVFISALVKYSGGYVSDFYLLYFITVGFSAYLLTMTATLILVGITTAAYLILCILSMQFESIIGLTLRVGVLWCLPLAIAFVSDYVRRSERRLLKLFDTLNQRTSELEKSQAHVEMIYENSRILGGIFDVDGMVEGVMKIMGSILSYPASGLVLVGPGKNLIYRGRNIGGQDNFHLKAVDESRSNLIRRVVSQAEPVVVVDISGRRDYPPLRLNTRSIMLVPMVTHGRATGILLAESPQVGAFTEKDLKILSVVARSGAMALDNATLHKRMEELTITDELTGIFNYRYFALKLKEEQRRAARYNLPLSLIMIDIDWFKKFNDTYGHEVGNIVLQNITMVVKKCIRDVDIFARYGGEEFVIILPQTPSYEVASIGERIRQSIETSTFGGSDGIPELSVTVSVGVSSYPENGKPNEELLSVVDQALYRAKGSGKNKVCVI
ncbi:MAG TPA: diguanylate cyclase [candidate division Zixibacteria bacterium]|nr:diguanylate cyclase [candidate division Zixibacteria bacterium]